MRFAFALLVAGFAALISFPGQSSGVLEPEGSVQADGAWELIINTLAPQTRYGLGAIYDPLDQRVLIFGGSSGQGEPLPAGTFLNDLWQISLGEPPMWTSLATSGTPPSPRHRFATVYDSKRHRLLLFGGWDGIGVRIDVFALTLSGIPSWIRISPQGGPPPARYGHSAIYDPPGDRVLIFGGCDGYSFLNDVWELSLSGTPQWRLVTPTGPAPGKRYGHTAIYDSRANRMIVFAGWQGSSFESGDQQMMNDTWSLTLDGTPAWSELSIGVTPPSPRFFHSAVFDSLGDRMVVHGGAGRVTPDPPEETWSLQLGDVPEWSKLPEDQPENLPPAYAFHAATIDRLSNRMIVIGGSKNGSAFTASFLPLSGDPIWSHMPLSPPHSYHDALVFDSRRRHVVLTKMHNAPFAISPDSLRWMQLTPQPGPGPVFQWRPWVVYDEPRDRMFFIDRGGTADPWYFSMGSREWIPGILDGPPFFHLDQGAALDPQGDTLWVVAAYPPQLWSVYLPEDRWTLMPTSANPRIPARARYNMIFDPVRRELIIFGGFYNETVYNDLWEIPVDGERTWQSLSASGVPPPQAGAAAYDSRRHRMVVVVENEVWELVLGASPYWQRPLLTGVAPDAFEDPTAAYDSVSARLFISDSVPWRKELWCISFGNEGTAPHVTLEKAEANLSRVDLQWLAPAHPGLMATVHRKVAGGDYATLSDVIADASGRIAFTDNAVERGNLYTYGLESGGVLVSEVHVYVPRAADVTSVIRVDADSLRALVTWGVGDNPGLVASVERRLDPGDWTPVADLIADLNGEIAYDDSAVVTGNTYSYRLVIDGEPVAPVDVEIPFPTPQFILISNEANLSRSKLLWRAPASPGVRATVHRSRAGESPVPLGEIVADPEGYLAFVDSSVTQGQSYVYNLEVSGNFLGDEAKVTVPVVGDVVTVVYSDIDVHRARIIWSVGNNPNLGLVVLRSLEPGGQVQTWPSSSDAEGAVTFEDSTVSAGASYTYRLNIGGSLAGGITLSALGSSTLSLAGAWPNPSSTGLHVTFTLATAQAATLELFDLRGRRLKRLDVGGLGPGDHSVDLSEELVLQSGTYIVRLTQAGAIRSRKVTYLR